ncbi:single-stranded DNA-binding protein [Candidatus Peregrinibacteria bacterium]|nr:single-stranded DNA-binding protein [Candidatus Peregrinibacteria bacterium]
MRSINKVILIGNLTRDPEMRQTPNGQPVVTFGIATNREWVTKDNIRKSSTEFHEIVAWARLAEICHLYLRKGKLIYIEGYLKTRSWDTPEGVKKFKTEIIMQDMIILEKRPKGEEISPVANEESGYHEENEETYEEEISHEKSAPEDAKKENGKKPDIDADLGL